MICCHQTRSRKNPCRLCRQIPALYKGVTINVMFKDERLFFIYKQFQAYGIMHPTTIKKLNVRVIMGRILKACVYLKKTINARFATFRFPIMQYGLPKYCIQFCISVVFNRSLRNRPLSRQLLFTTQTRISFLSFVII